MSNHAADLEVQVYNMTYYHTSITLFSLCLALLYLLIRQHIRTRKFIVKIRKDIAELKKEAVFKQDSSECSDATIQRMKTIDDALLIAIVHSKKENGGTGDEYRFVELHRAIRKSLP